MTTYYDELPADEQRRLTVRVLMAVARHEAGGVDELATLTGGTEPVLVHTADTVRLEWPNGLTAHAPVDAVAVAIAALLARRDERRASLN